MEDEGEGMGDEKLPLVATEDEGDGVGDGLYVSELDTLEPSGRASL